MTTPTLAKIIHSEFNVFQFINPNGKVYRIYEQRNGSPLGIKDMHTKVIHPLSEQFYKSLYFSVRYNDVIN